MSVYIRCKVESGLVILESDEKLTEPKIVTLTGADTDCRQLECIRKDGRYHITFEASSLEKWSPDTPVLYQLKAGSLTERFGFCELKTFSNTDVLLNGESLLKLSKEQLRLRRQKIGMIFQHFNLLEQQTVLENAGQLEDILRQLVLARIDLARANGFGDLAQQRLGYGRAELDAFCRQVQTHITPLYLRLQEEQRQRLGVEALLPYDRALVFPEGNAVPVAAEELPEAARRMYHALSPEAGAFFDEMVRHDLLDVTGSPNKISGMGFCEMLGAPYDMPFVFANCDGTAGDVTVYTHELGHGLQGYLSIRSQPVADYVGLSPDLAEVHSKTMELLAQPYARDFFGNHAPQFLTEHRYDFIKEMCAFCSIHTFETWLYEHPDASLAQWAEEFDRIEKSFGRARNNEPWRQQVLSGCDLFTNMSLYMSPRYVISYALSIVCAQQLKAAYDADPADGWARYHALCASGGSRTYAETLSDAGLPLPYAPGVVESLAQDLSRQLWG